jgi:catechol 2,3-dioxygenase-like lactoylglutathione lyase family enzyme
LIVDGDILSVKAELEAKHAPIICGIVEQHGSKGAMQSLYLRDPDGNLVELSSYSK